MKKLIAEITQDDVTSLSIKNALSISFGALDRGDISDLTNWGCFSNKGEVVFIDSSKEFKTISNNDNLKVKIYYASASVKKLLATFLIDDFDYEHESGKVTITLKDSLIDWQEQSVDEYYEFQEETMDKIHESIYGDISNVSPIDFERMKKTYVNTSYMRKDSKWSNADKLCQANMVRCFCDNNGIPLFSSEVSKQENNILITPKNILSVGNKSRVNKPKGFSISAYNIQKQVDQKMSSSFAFTWYSIKGTTNNPHDSEYNYILARWEDYSNNCQTGLNKNHEGFYTEAWVSTDIKKEQNLYNISRVVVEESVSTSKKSDNGQIEKTKYTFTKEKNFGATENPENGIIAFDNGENITVYFEDSNAVDVAFDDGDGSVGVYVVSEHVANEGTISVYGNFFKEDGEVEIGETSDSSIKLQSNELIQTQSHYIDKSLAQNIVDTAKSRYGNGIECLELEVTPSDYYDDLGNKIIDTKGEKPLFEKYDIITPYVIRNGFKQPYSTKQDGSAKNFKVIGIDYSQKGILRQKLYLQENV